ncbi:MAG: lytic transglycosylase domain-containing protein [Pararhizobium sp.]|nr:lytic transglycosylase domain-containing protein [Pararhizobium sp.]MDO9414758.1 lytic transglycosylase domain-containing protein [Pararhizobium sp.]
MMSATSFSTFASAQPEWSAPARPVCLYSAQSRTNPGSPLCIRKESFARDICTAIEEFSVEHTLPPDYFARLIWKESLFDPNAVSPKGAEGIAQFMPGTAKLRKLSNSFDALEALRKSAEYLDELRDRFGNLGLAAAAYNAGEARVSSFLNDGSLPYETRDYVLSITALAAEDWRDNPPQSFDARLDKEKTFIDACVVLASTRRMKELNAGGEGVWKPWGVQLAAHFQKNVAMRLFTMAVKKLPAPIRDEKPLVRRERNRHIGARARYTARIGRDSRAEAETLCGTIKANGGACVVFKN